MARERAEGPSELRGSLRFHFLRRNEISVLKTFFPDKPHSLETKFLDAFLEENLSAKSQ